MLLLCPCCKCFMPSSGYIRKLSVPLHQRKFNLSILLLSLGRLIGGWEDFVCFHKFLIYISCCWVGSEKWGILSPLANTVPEQEDVSADAFTISFNPQNLSKLWRPISGLVGWMNCTVHLVDWILCGVSLWVWSSMPILSVHPGECSVLARPRVSVI